MSILDYEHDPKTDYPCKPRYHCILRAKEQIFKELKWEGEWTNNYSSSYSRVSQTVGHDSLGGSQLDCCFIG